MFAFAQKETSYLEASARAGGPVFKAVWALKCFLILEILPLRSESPAPPLFKKLSVTFFRIMVYVVTLSPPPTHPPLAACEN